MDDEATLKAEIARMHKGFDADAEAVRNAARKRDLLTTTTPTPAEREAQTAYLAALAHRANLAAGSVTDYHRNLLVAERDRQEYERSIAFLTSLTPDEYPDLTEEKQAELELSVDSFRVNLAAAYFTLGEFGKAVDIYPFDDEALAHYAEYARAERAVDCDFCACPVATTHEETGPHTGGVTHQVENMTVTYEGKFPSPRLNTTLYAVRCVHPDCAGPSLTLRTSPDSDAERDLAATAVKEAPWQALAPQGGCCPPAEGRTLEDRYEEFYAKNPQLDPRRRRR